MMRRLLRSWALILAAMLWVVAAATPMVFGASISAPLINVRWAPDIAEGDRTGIEEQLALVRHERLKETVWSYALLDQSREHLRALVQHPSVADTEGIDRAQFAVQPNRSWITVPAAARLRWTRSFAAYWRAIARVSGLAAMTVTAIALRRRPRWLLVYGCTIVLAIAVLFSPIGPRVSATTPGAALKETLSGLEFRRPGWGASFPDETIFGSWVTMSAAPCQDGPGEFSMWIKPDWTVQIRSAGEGTRLYHIEELRRAAITPRAWERGSVVLTGRMADGAGVRMLLRQTHDNIMETLIYEVQAASGDITILPALPPPLANCGQSP